jgi:uncharacterized membrane protein
MSPIKEKQIHQAFEIGVILKGLHAFLELAVGALLVFMSSNTIVNIVASLTQEELTEDPNDLVAHYLFQSAQHLSVGGRAFAAWYLLSHGVIKLLLVVGLLKKKLWAYPASLVVLGFFILYQVYRFTLTHSLWLVLLSIFDLIVIGLVWHEYQLMRRVGHKAS